MGFDKVIALCLKVFRRNCSKYFDSRFSMPARLEAPEALRRCKALMEREGLDPKTLLSEIEGLKLDERTFEKYLNDPDRARLTPAALNAINKYLELRFANADSGFMYDYLGGFPDYLYFSMLRYLRCTLSTEVETKESAAGLYRLYRPSLKIPNMITVGAFNITNSTQSSALCVEEVRRYKGVQQSTDDLYGDEEGISEEFHGYMIRKRRRYICLQRGKRNPNFLVTIFNDEFLDGDAETTIKSLGGIVFGTSGSRIYVSRVYIERCKPGVKFEDLKNDIDYYPEEKIRPSIRRNLSLKNGEMYYVF